MKLDDIIKHMTRLQQLEEKATPVEFRELRHPSKMQA